MGNSSSESGQTIALPKGGGALRGIGEKFSPDLHTGTGNFTIPIALPPGRNGFQPQLNLVYSTGNGNGPFGLGWSSGIPGVSRKTSKGIPRYDEAKDVFILSGAEDLVALSTAGTATDYRPRTEGLFAQIRHVRDPANSYWEVRSKDGLLSVYGTENALGMDAAAVADPGDRTKTFAWKLTRTVDPFGNRIEYAYERDTGDIESHHWDQSYLRTIQYVDHDGDPAGPRFLVTVELVYEIRPDPFSEYRSGFEIRTRKRCSQILVRTHADTEQLVRSYRFVYLDTRPEATRRLPANGVSLLSRIEVTGHDGERSESLPPLEFGYTNFEPAQREFFPLQGRDLPARSLANPDLELVDLFGNGLPDLMEMNGVVRYWRNLGEGRFDAPRMMREAPALALADAGVQFVDANGDGRTDLLVTDGTTSGYFPINFSGGWDRRSFQRYDKAPSFSLKDPEVKLIDLDGDGITDAIRSGSRLECFFNDPHEGWNRTRVLERKALAVFPNVNFSDPRVKWADLSGDGLQDVALVHNGSTEYWPNLGHGNWGRRVRMENSPRFPHGYDPRRILIGDVDGDGLADIVYVDNTRVTLWINQSGNRWSDPITILGTPAVSDADAVRLTDVLGSGIGGVLWTRDANSLSRDHTFFLDFTGGLKPYLLHEMDNHIGAVTRVDYAPSTRFYLRDQQRPETRWKTTLPFPVHVVSRVEVIDHFSRGKLTTEYHYHHGYWDGAEREFRGFGMVEQRDTEAVGDYASSGLHGDEHGFAPIDQQRFSPPTLNRTWFHQGPVGDEFGDWHELDRSDEYWVGDPLLLTHTESVNQFLRALPLSGDVRRVKRDALRTLRGSVLRTELYALDGSDREKRPYTVTESSYGLVEIDPPVAGTPSRLHIFFPHETSHRVTQWERGDDPMTQFAYMRYTDENGVFDAFGRLLGETAIACPRGWRSLDDKPAAPYLSTRLRTLYATPLDSNNYIHARIAATTSYEIRNTSGKRVTEIIALADASADLTVIGQTRSFYDGRAFFGLPLGQVGRFGAITRSESLTLTDEILQRAYGASIPPYLEPTGQPSWNTDYPAEFRTLLPTRAGYTFHAGSAAPFDEQGYFVTTARRRYDFQTGTMSTGRGLAFETLDPLHDKERDPSAHRTLVEYDDYQLLPTKLMDAAGLTTQASYNYRVMQVSALEEPNGNTTLFTFTPLGMVASTFIRGKTAAEGDQLLPSVRVEYELNAFDDSPASAREPILVRTVRRMYHDSDLSVPSTDRDATITTVEYTDGFGRLLQTRSQGDDIRFGDARFGGGESLLPAKQRDGIGGVLVGRANNNTTAPNVVVTGWLTYDNKGSVVESYEPFLSEGWAYRQPDDHLAGQKIVTFYDARGHAVRTVYPDGTVQRIIFGVPGTIDAPALTDPDRVEPTPWEAYTYDANDNAGRTDPGASVGYAHHWDTPASIVVDGLGRTVKAVERNRDARLGPDGAPPAIEVLESLTTYDTRGNVLTVTDPLGRAASFNHVYDCANRRLRVDNIDAGTRTSVFDARGEAVEQRDGKGALVLHNYDILNRPHRLWARDGNGRTVTLRERLEYGDAGSARQGPAERSANRHLNRLGRLFRHYDEAGMVLLALYDFKGNVVEKSRQVLPDNAILGGFTPAPVGWVVTAFNVDWTSPANVDLDGTIYTTSLRYDALGRVTHVTCPQDVDGRRRILAPQYNRAGGLQRLTVDGVVFVERIVNNAKGQRVLIAYGNGVLTRHLHDPRSFRIIRTTTAHYTTPSALTYVHTGPTLQDISYDYDLAGNILTIRDRTAGCGIIGTELGVDALDRAFTYDALGRLRSASGRECDRLRDDRPWDPGPRCSDLTKTRGYSEHYRYDGAGNLIQLRHGSNGAATNRDVALVPGSNRVSRVTTGLTAILHAYDANGNMVSETASRHFEWDHADRLHVYRTQISASEPTVHAHYLYAADGRRVKKVVRKAGGLTEVTVYIDGLFEHRRVREAENNTVHVMDDQDRLALIRIGRPFTGDTTPAVTYCIADHMRSVSVIVDQSGSSVSAEEYTPYGETSFGGFVRKRYRFTGRERDEESGLVLVGYRYYAPWIARWMSCDPAGAVSGQNRYQYVGGNTPNLIDHAGLDESLPGGTGNTAEEDAAGVDPKKEHVTPGGKDLNAGVERVHQSKDDLTINVTALAVGIKDTAINSAKSVAQHSWNAMVVKSTKDPALIAKYEEKMVAEDMQIAAGILDDLLMTNTANAPKTGETGVGRSSDLALAGSLILVLAPEFRGVKGVRLTLKSVEEMGFTARAADAGTLTLTRELSIADREAAEGFRRALLDEKLTPSLAGDAGHAAGGAAGKGAGVDYRKFNGAFQQELKLHSWMPEQRWLDKASTQSLNYSLQYQLDPRTAGLVPIRSVKHIFVSRTDAVMSVTH